MSTIVVWGFWSKEDREACEEGQKSTQQVDAIRYGIARTANELAAYLAAPHYGRVLGFHNEATDAWYGQETACTYLGGSYQTSNGSSFFPHHSIFYANGDEG